jgi:predicted hydrocarbon binding protein
MANDLLPKAFPILHFDPERKTFEIVARIKNPPGSLAALLSVLSRDGVDIINSLTYERENYAVWIAFVQHKNEKTVHELTDLVNSSSSTLSCAVSESVDGFLVENMTFPLAGVDQDRAIIVRAQLFRDMMQKLRDEFQSAADLFLFKEGNAMGESAEKLYIEKFGLEKLISDLSYLHGIYSALGWARAELVRANIPGHFATIRLHESFECPSGGGQKPYSHFLRGFINGSFSVMMGAKTQTKEVKCVAKGDQFCEFEVGEARTLA